MMNSSPLVDHNKARWLLAGAAVGLLLGQAVLPTLPGDPVAKVAVVAANQTAVTISAAAFLASGILTVLAMMALNTADVPRARGLVTVGMVLTAVGALWPVGGRAAFNLIMLALAGGEDRASAAAAAHAIDGSGTLAILLLTLAAFALGPVILVIGLWRAGIAPVWPALLWFVGVVVVNGAEESSRPVSSVGMLAAATALTWLGATISGTRAAVPVRASNPANPSATLS
jgi:hypothetical protein